MDNTFSVFSGVTKTWFSRDATGIERGGGVSAVSCIESLKRLLSTGTSLPFPITVGVVHRFDNKGGGDILVFSSLEDLERT